MEILRLFIAIFFATFIGWNILCLISRNRVGLLFLEQLALSYGLGLGFISLEMLFFYFVKIEFSQVNIILPWSLLLLITLTTLFKKRAKDITLNSTKAKVRWLPIVLLSGGIAFEIIYAVFRALIKPMEAYDAIAIYAIKAKAFYLAKSIPSDFFNKAINFFPHPDYPLNIPLVETFIYVFLGNVNDQLVKIIFPLYFVSILILLYFAVRRFASSTYALLFTFLLATVAQFNDYAQNGYCDLPLAYYIFAGALFLFKWFEDKSQISFLMISACMTALAGWTKNEGLMYCIIYISLLVYFLFDFRKELGRKGALYASLYVGAISLIALPWLWIKRTFGLINHEVDFGNLFLLTMKSLLQKVVCIGYEFEKQFLGPKKWNIIWPLALFIFIANFRIAIRGTNRYITLLILSIILGYILAYISTNLDIRILLRFTWSRFLIHFLPLVVYLLARISKEDVNL